MRLGATVDEWLGTTVDEWLGATVDEWLGQLAARFSNNSLRSPSRKWVHGCRQNCEGEKW